MDRESLLELHMNQIAKVSQKIAQPESLFLQDVHPGFVFFGKRPEDPLKKIQDGHVQGGQRRIELVKDERQQLSVLFQPAVVPPAGRAPSKAQARKKPD